MTTNRVLALLGCALALIARVFLFGGHGGGRARPGPSAASGHAQSRAVEHAELETPTLPHRRSWAA